MISLDKLFLSGFNFEKIIKGRYFSFVWSIILLVDILLMNQSEINITKLTIEYIIHIPIGTILIIFGSIVFYFSLCFISIQILQIILNYYCFPVRNRSVNRNFYDKHTIKKIAIRKSCSVLHGICRSLEEEEENSKINDTFYFAYSFATFLNLGYGIFYKKSTIMAAIWFIEAKDIVPYKFLYTFLIISSVVLLITSLKLKNFRAHLPSLYSLRQKNLKKRRRINRKKYGIDLIHLDKLQLKN